MSHIVQIQTEVRDAAAIGAACARLGLDQRVFGQARLFSGTASGWQVRLPGWRYPIVCDVGTGRIELDDYSGHWGEQKHLDAFMQAYAVERTKIEARRAGHSVTEQTLEDGSIKLAVHVGGE